MEFLGTASDIIGVAGALFALFAWLQASRTQQELAQERARLAERVEVELVLASNGDRRRLPILFPRAVFTRGELLGWLGMVPMADPGKRFSLAYLATENFRDQLATAQSASGPVTIVIPCTSAEFAQFA